MAEQTSQGTSREPKRTTVPFALEIVVFIGVTLRVIALLKPISGDEMTVYLFFLQHGWHALFQSWADPYPPFLIDIANHPVNNILTYLSLVLFSDVNVWSLRLPAFLFGCMTIPAAYALARACKLDYKTALCVAFSLAICNGAVQWSGLSRGYAPMVFFECLFLIGIVTLHRPRNYIGWVLTISSGALMMYSHLIALAVFACVGCAYIIECWFAFRQSKREESVKNTLSRYINVPVALILSGCVAAILYAPQFSVVHTLLAMLREGGLPESTFGQIPGFNDQPPESGGASNSLGEMFTFVMSANNVFAIGIVSGLTAFGLWILAREHRFAALNIGFILLLPIAYAILSSSSPSGRYFLFMIPAFAIVFGIGSLRCVTMIADWASTADIPTSKRRNVFEMIAVLTLISLLCMPTTGTYLFDKRPDRVGPWNLDGVEHYLNRHARSTDLIWMFSLGNDAHIEAAPGYVQPYGRFARLGAFANQRQSSDADTPVEIYYVSPLESDIEQPFFPPQFNWSLITTIDRTHIYKVETGRRLGTFQFPLNLTLHMPPELEQIDPKPITLEQDGGSSTIRVSRTNSEGVLYSDRFSVVPRMPIRISVRVTHEPRFFSGSAFLYGITYFDSDANIAKESFGTIWPNDASRNPDGQCIVSISEPVPSNAATARFTVLVQNSARPDDQVTIHSVIINGLM